MAWGEQFERRENERQSHIAVAETEARKAIDILAHTAGDGHLEPSVDVLVRLGMAEAHLALARARLAHVVRNKESD